MNLSIERVVALATPIFSALSAAGTGWLGTHFPGLPHLNPGDVTALEIAGASAAAAAALKWLHGRQKLVTFTDQARQAIADAAHSALANQQAAPALEDIAKLIEANRAQIVTAIGSAVHAPPAVDQVLEAVAQKLGAPGPVSPLVSGTSGPAA